MIGGAMLLCAVGAMLLIAHWSQLQDDLPDAAAQTGLLALRHPPATRAPARRGHSPARGRRQSHKQREPDAPPRREADALPRLSILSDVEARLIDDELAEQKARVQARRQRRAVRTVHDGSAR